jgi:endonuclease III
LLFYAQDDCELQGARETSMKNSREYAKKVHKLYRSLKRKYPKVEQPVYADPTEALVYALVSEDMDEAAAQAAIKRFDDFFIDLNDLRVSRVEEIVEALGADTLVTRNIASTLNRVLWAIFNKYNMVTLEPLKKMSKRPARQILEKMDGASHFAVNYSTLTSLRGHAIPLTKRMIEYLKDNQLVHPESDEQEIEGFLTRQVSAASAYEFYALLRRRSEARRGRAKKKTTRKTKVKPKTTTKRKK